MSDEQAEALKDTVAEWLETLGREELERRAEDVLEDEWREWIAPENDTPTIDELIDVILSEVGAAELFKEIP